MKRPWMPLYVADYLADTVHLTPAEHGAYLLLLMYYWAHGGLPADENTVRRITRMSPVQWKRSGKIVLDFFTIEGITRRNKRADKELAKVIEISKVNSANAQRSHINRKKVARHTHTHKEETHTSSVCVSTESPSFGVNSERSPDAGELASAMGDARRSPPSVDPPLNEPEGKKRLTEEERAAHVAQVLRGFKPKSFPESDHPSIAPTPAGDLLADPVPERPLTPTAALLRTPLVQKANGAGNPEAPLSRTEVGKLEGWDWEPPRKKLTKMSLAELMAEPDDSQEKVA